RAASARARSIKLGSKAFAFLRSSGKSDIASLFQSRDDEILSNPKCYYVHPRDWAAIAFSV
ncbi:MAG: hypothetical protein VW714_10140, partial [Rhodospirillales bacterium]